MDIKAYQDWVQDTMDYPYKHNTPEEALIHFSLGLNGEAGEVAEVVKKRVYSLDPLCNTSSEALIGELGDVMWYLTAMCCAAGLSLEHVLQHNKNKLEDRYELKSRCSKSSETL